MVLRITPRMLKRRKFVGRLLALGYTLQVTR
jgi:hypothetical protein